MSVYIYRMYTCRPAVVRSYSPCNSTQSSNHVNQMRIWQTYKYKLVCTAIKISVTLTSDIVT